MMLSLIIGIGIATFSTIMPFGNSISSIIIINLLCNYFNISPADTQCAIVSGSFGYMILSTLRDVLDKEFSSEQEIIILNNSNNGRQLWESLEILVLQQIVNIVNVKILGIICGLIFIYIYAAMLGMNKGSMALTLVVIPFLLYKLYTDMCYISFTKNIPHSELLISGGIYLLYAPLCLKVLTSMSIAYPSVIIIYSLFLIPNLISNIISNFQRNKQRRLDRLDSHTRINMCNYEL